MAIVIEGLTDLMRKLDRMNGNLKGALTRAVKQTCETARAEAAALSNYGSVRNSIQEDVKVDGDSINGIVSSKHPASMYIEFGTGPKGQADHAGISPKVPVTYTQHSWVYHSEEYGFVTTKGQPAQPYMYPAVKITEPVFKQNAQNELLKEIMRASNG